MNKILPFILGAYLLVWPQSNVAASPSSTATAPDYGSLGRAIQSEDPAQSIKDWIDSNFNSAFPTREAFLLHSLAHLYDLEFDFAGLDPKTAETILSACGIERESYPLIARSLDVSLLHAFGRSVPRFFTTLYFPLWITMIPSTVTLYKQAQQAAGTQGAVIATIASLFVIVGFPTLVISSEMREAIDAIANKRVERILNRDVFEGGGTLAVLCSAALRVIGTGH